MRNFLTGHFLSELAAVSFILIFVGVASLDAVPQGKVSIYEKFYSSKLAIRIENLRYDDTLVALVGDKCQFITSNRNEFVFTAPSEDFDVLIRDDTCENIYRVSLARDSIFISPLKAGSFVLTDYSHKRISKYLKHNLYWLTIREGSELNTESIRQMLIKRFQDFGMVYILLLDGDYFHFHVKTDSIQRLLTGNSEWTPVLFFEYSGFETGISNELHKISDSLGNNYCDLKFYYNPAKWSCPEPLLPIDTVTVSHVSENEMGYLGSIIECSLDGRIKLLLRSKKYFKDSGHKIAFEMLEADDGLVVKPIINVPSDFLANRQNYHNSDSIQAEGYCTFYPPDKRFNLYITDDIDTAQFSICIDLNQFSLKPFVSRLVEIEPLEYQRLSPGLLFLLLSTMPQWNNTDIESFLREVENDISDIHPKRTTIDEGKYLIFLRNAIPVLYDVSKGAFNYAREEKNVGDSMPILFFKYDVNRITVSEIINSIKSRDWEWGISTHNTCDVQNKW